MPWGQEERSTIICSWATEARVEGELWEELLVDCAQLSGGGCSLIVTRRHSISCCWVPKGLLLIYVARNNI